MNTKINQPKRWYDYTAAAAYLGLSPRQVMRARASGKLGYTKLGGQRVFFDEAQLDAYIAACTVEPTA